jgi:hypothetical protein
MCYLMDAFIDACEKRPNSVLVATAASTGSSLATGVYALAASGMFQDRPATTIVTGVSMALCAIIPNIPPAIGCLGKPAEEPNPQL